MIIIYGTKVFTKNMGYYGEKAQCESCGKEYPYSFVKISTWFHICYIPLFPVKKTYYKMCPVCSAGVEMKSKAAKAEMKSLQKTDCQLQIYAKHVLANKPKKFLASDTSYELWAKDAATGADFCITTGITKGKIKEIKKARGLKAIPIVEV